MPIVSADLKWYGSAVMPLDLTTLDIGGAIDLTKRIIFTRLVSESNVEMLSSDAGDTTQTVTIYFITTAGVLSSEVKTLNGVSVVSFTTAMRTILRILKSASTTGTITVRKASAGATVIALAPAEIEAHIPFYNQIADPDVAVVTHERIFVKNTHATLSLTQGVVTLQADPQSIITFAIDAAYNGTNTNGAGNSRAVAPSGYTFNTSAKNIPSGQVMAASEALGMWLKSTLGAGKAPFDDTFTLRLAGVSA